MGVVLVCGPACGGKSTWVQSMMAEGNVVVDFDDIVEEIGGQRYAPTPGQVEQARAIWAQRIRAWHGPGICWVIWAGPTRQQRGRFRQQYGARVVVVRASMDVCLERARGTRPPAWEGRIRAWFRDWQPSRSTLEPTVDTTPEPSDGARENLAPNLAPASPRNP